MSKAKDPQNASVEYVYKLGKSIQNTSSKIRKSFIETRKMTKMLLFEIRKISGMLPHLQHFDSIDFGNISKKPIFCKPRANRGVCLTEGCVNAAYHILERANLSVDPCEDFYEFACGTFVHNSKIPDSKSGYYYYSERIEKNGVNPLNEIMKEMGGWPVLEGDDWNSKDFKWIDIILKRRKIGFSINTIFIFDVDVNVQNSSQWMIWLDQPILPVPHEYLLQGLNESDVQAFLQYAIDLAVLLGANKTTAKKEMTEVVGFMTDMSKC
ncbi:hypothetical protein Avbf_10556 [Armadillidium vulgare]|nr:hypothetical protein Avbf_10556 [Armadillidium vulgare]